MKEAEISGSRLMLVLSSILFLILYAYNALNLPFAAAFAFWFIFLILQERKVKYELDIKEIEKKSEVAIQERQTLGRIPKGTIRVMTEVELKDILMQLKNPGEFELKPHIWFVGVKVESVPPMAYLVKVSRYGTIRGISEIEIPEEFSMQKTPSIIRANLPKGERPPIVKEENIEREEV